MRTCAHAKVWSPPAPIPDYHAWQQLLKRRRSIQQQLAAADVQAKALANLLPPAQRAAKSERVSDAMAMFRLLDQEWERVAGEVLGPPPWYAASVAAGNYGAGAGSGPSSRAPYMHGGMKRLSARSISTGEVEEGAGSGVWGDMTVDVGLDGAREPNAVEAVGFRSPRSTTPTQVQCCKAVLPCARLLACLCVPVCGCVCVPVRVWRMAASCWAAIDPLPRFPFRAVPLLPATTQLLSKVGINSADRCSAIVVCLLGETASLWLWLAGLGCSGSAGRCACAWMLVCIFCVRAPSVWVTCCPGDPVPSPRTPPHLAPHLCLFPCPRCLWQSASSSAS